MSKSLDCSFKQSWLIGHSKLGESFTTVSTAHKNTERQFEPVNSSAFAASVNSKL